MKYIYSTSQMSKLSLILCTFSVTGSVASCYDSRLKVSSQETTLVLSNTRELDRVPSTE